MTDISQQKTVYVLGAGCSKNYENPDAPLGLEPPLDRDFFEMAAKVLLQHDRIPDRFKTLVLGTRSLYHFQSTQISDILEEWLTSPMSLESTFTFVDIETENEGASGQFFRKARQELVKLVRLTFYRALEGPPCPLHSKLATNIQQNDTVISYNYDILADNALFLDNKMNENNYLVPFWRTFYRGDWLSPRKPISNIRLIKLHGSLNWLSCGRCNSLLCFLGEKTPEDYSSSLPTLVNCPHCGSNELEYVLIPPILHKSYDLPSMKLLWKTAENVLSSADRIVVIGYSLPPTDFRSELLFRLALGKKKVAIDIVNPDRDHQVLNRFKSILTPISDRVSITHYASSLQEFLDKNQQNPLII